MSHIDLNSTTRGAKHPEWLQVGADIGMLTNKISGRYDIVGLASPEAGSGAPACFKPLIAEVEVNTEVAFGIGVTPEMIGDISMRDAQYEFPKATGAIAHEAFHARFSQWNMKQADEDLTNEEFEALILLEESRIEAQGAKAEPRYRSFLRASALEIALTDLENYEGGSVKQLAQTVGLLHGRVIGGILEIEDAEEALDIVESQLGKEIVEKLCTILREYQKHSNHTDITPTYPLAKEWVKIVNEVSEERGESPTEEQKEAMKKLLEALSESAEGMAIGVHSELSDQQTEEEWKDIVDYKAEKAKEKAESKKVSSEVFGKNSGPAGASTMSKLCESRPPSSQERSAAVIISKMLEKAKYRERDVVEVSSALPAGRLRTKALVQGQALKEKGVRVEVEPWRKKVRKHTEDPTLTVGVMVDISGSMSSAMEPMATTAWVMSEAVRRVQGKCAMVYYGMDVFPTLKPGQHLSEVNVYTAPDGTEEFDKAFKAINGSVDLLNGTGARLLVVVSDGEYRPDQSKKARQWLARCEQAGVAVLWLPFDNGYSARDLLRGSKAGVVAGTMDPTQTASEIGAMAAKVLTEVGKRNSA